MRLVNNWLPPPPRAMIIVNNNIGYFGEGCSYNVDINVGLYKLILFYLQRTRLDYSVKRSDVTGNRFEW